MNIPGFQAEATIYRSRIAYQAAWASRETAGSGFDRVIPMAPVGGDICNPFCEICESDISSRTGCSQSCTARNCNEYTRSCTGCSNPCQGGQICRGVCTDTSKDPSNCGTCGNACPSGVSCLNGACGCPSGQTPLQRQVYRSAHQPVELRRLRQRLRRRPNLRVRRVRPRQLSSLLF